MCVFSKTVHTYASVRRSTFTVGLIFFSTSPLPDHPLTQMTGAMPALLDARFADWSTTLLSALVETASRSPSSLTPSESTLD